MVTAFDVEGTLVYIGKFHQSANIQALLNLGLIPDETYPIPNNKGYSLQGGLRRFQKAFKIPDQNFIDFKDSFIERKLEILHQHILQAHREYCIVNSSTWKSLLRQELKVLITNEDIRTIDLLDDILKMHPDLVIASNGLKIGSVRHTISFGKPYDITNEVARLIREFKVSAYCGDTDQDRLFAEKMNLTFYQA